MTNQNNEPRQISFEELKARLSPMTTRGPSWGIEHPDPWPLQLAAVKLTLVENYLDLDNGSHPLISAKMDGELIRLTGGDKTGLYDPGQLVELLGANDLPLNHDSFWNVVESARVGE